MNPGTPHPPEALYVRWDGSEEELDKLSEAFAKVLTNPSGGQVTVMLSQDAARTKPMPYIPLRLRIDGLFWYLPWWVRANWCVFQMRHRLGPYRRF